MSHTEHSNFLKTNHSEYHQSNIKSHQQKFGREHSTRFIFICARKNDQMIGFLAKK